MKSFQSTIHVVFLLLLGTTITKCSNAESTSDFGDFGFTKTQITEDIIATTRTTKKVVEALADSVSPVGMSILGAVGYTIIPISQKYFESRNDNHNTTNDLLVQRHDFYPGDPDAIPKTAFERSMLYAIVEAISQFCKMGASVYVVEYMAVALSAMGLSRSIKGRDIRASYARIIHVLWGCQRIKVMKRSWLRTLFHVERTNRDTMGAATAYNVIVNLVLFFSTFLIILDLLDLQIGFVMKTIFTFSGLGTLAVGLASKDIISQYLIGLGIKTSGKFLVGENVILGDGTKGKIVKCGWTETIIQGTNDIPVRIPNQQIFNQRVSNVSRVNLSQVKKRLLFPLTEINKMPSLMRDIKKEIILTCPFVITNGRKPLRVHVVDFDKYHVVVEVDTHLRVPPYGDIHYEKRQQVLFAVSRAIERHELTFMGA